MITWITNHIQKAIDRLWQQYKGVTSVENYFTALTEEAQEIEDQLKKLFEERNLETAVGKQLDRIGEVVGQDREGLTDEPYRLRIKIKIIQNLSEGEPERVIQVYKFLLNASWVFYSELYPANCYLMGAGSIIPGTEQLIAENIIRILPATVTLEYFGHADPVKPFKFAGNQVIGGGFGTIYDSTIGGKLGSLYQP